MFKKKSKEDVSEKQENIETVKRESEQDNSISNSDEYIDISDDEKHKINRTIITFQIIGILLGVLFSFIFPKSVFGDLGAILLPTIISSLFIALLGNNKIVFVNIFNRRRAIFPQRIFIGLISVVFVILISFLMNARSLPTMIMYCILGINIPLLSEYKVSKYIAIQRVFLLSTIIMFLISFTDMKTLLSLGNTVFFIAYCVMIILCLGCCEDGFNKSLTGFLLILITVIPGLGFSQMLALMTSYIVGILLCKRITVFEPFNFISLRIPLLGILDSTPLYFIDKYKCIIMQKRDMNYKLYEEGKFDDIVNRKTKEPSKKEEQDETSKKQQNIDDLLNSFSEEEFK